MLDLPAAQGVSPVPNGVLAGHLALARERGFVGRTEELDRFVGCLDGDGLTRVLYVHGPGGIGKSALLDAFAARACQAGRSVVRLDGRELLCSTAAVTEAVGTGCEVLLIDAYELLEPLDTWFRTSFLPALPSTAVTVLATRTPPHDGWRRDLGWRQTLAVCPLQALSDTQSRELLARNGVADSQQSALVVLARGHPLALSMLAETCAAADGPPQRLSDAPDLVAELCARIVDDVPDDDHRRALATCAHVSRLTEDLLERTAGGRADTIWRWLEARPYVHRTASGLRLQDLVRDLFDAEYSQRRPDAYRRLREEVRAYLLGKLADPGEPNPDRPAMELLCLHQRSPLDHHAGRLRELGALPVTQANSDEAAAIVSLIGQEEGPAAEAIAAQWVGLQPRGLYRVRSVDGAEGFAMHVYLSGEGCQETHDPVAAAVLDAVAQHGPLRPGEQVHVNRFSGASGDYARDPMVLLANGVSCILEWGRPAAWTFIVTIDPDFYGPYFEYLGLVPMLRVAGERREWCAYGWDRRRLPMESFFEMMAGRELSGQTGPPPARFLRPLPLSPNEFADAVRAALRLIARPEQLGCSALLTTSLVAAACDDKTTRLAATITDGIGQLRGEAGGEDLYRVLARTYLKGTPSQEAAARMLNLSFSTYRRRLARAEQRLVEVLWDKDITAEPTTG